MWLDILYLDFINIINKVLVTWGTIIEIRLKNKYNYIN